MNDVLLNHLKNRHSDDGYIVIDDSREVLDLTAELISTDAETDFDCMIDQLRESDELTTFLTNMVKRITVDVVVSHIDLENLAESNLKELIESKLRAE